MAGVISSTIVAVEITALVGQAGSQSSETLPVIGFEPLDD